MAFWRLGFGPTSAIDSLLANVTPSNTLTSSPPTRSASAGLSPTTSTFLRTHKSSSSLASGEPRPTHPLLVLEKILDEDDFLQEVKIPNQKLVEFLTRDDVLRRLLAFASGTVGWDEGGEEEEEMFEGRGDVQAPADEGHRETGGSLGIGGLGSLMFGVMTRSASQGSTGSGGGNGTTAGSGVTGYDTGGEVKTLTKRVKETINSAAVATGATSKDFFDVDDSDEDQDQTGGSSSGSGSGSASGSGSGSAGGVGDGKQGGSGGDGGSSSEEDNGHEEREKTLQEQEQEMTDEQRKKRIKYPYLCSEVLSAGDAWAITEAVFNDPTTYLASFWDEVLDQPTEVLAQRSVQLGYWGKVNSMWLKNRTAEMINFIKNQPRIIERLLNHISLPPITDLLLSLIKCEETRAGNGIIEWLASEHLIPRLVSLLSPSHPPETHATVAEFLKDVVHFSSTANSANLELLGIPGGGGGGGNGGGGGGGGPNGRSGLSDGDDGPMRWASNRLIRDLVAEDTIAILISYMLDEVPIPEFEWEDGEKASKGALGMQLGAVAEVLKGSEGGGDEAEVTGKFGLGVKGGGRDGKKKGDRSSMGSFTVIPLDDMDVGPMNETREASGTDSHSRESSATAGTIKEARTPRRTSVVPTLPAVTSSSSSNEPSHPSNAAATSSLIHSISVIVDLIRKNNSDFVEQQILHWLRKVARDKEAEESAEMGLGTRDHQDDGKGPSVVNLGTLLTVISARLGDFQRLIARPRSLAGPINTTIGSLIPLTFERLRICELYAELLHCSNMALLNRSPGSGPTYDEDGHIVGGIEALRTLTAALSPSGGVPGSGAAGEDWASDPVTADTSIPSSIATSKADDSDDDLIESTETISLDETLNSSSANAHQLQHFSEPPFALDLNTPDSSSSDSSPASTPSEQASIDSESGILTRDEARALRDIVQLAEKVEKGEVSVDPEAKSKPGLRRRHSSFAESGQDLVVTPSETSSRRRRSTTIGATRPNGLAKNSLLPGDLLKQKLMEHRIPETLLDLFFTFPWNNFLHNAVFDMVQQIFNGRMDRVLNRHLALSIFSQGALVDRILMGQQLNDEITAREKGVRLGYMGHMTLMADEVVKVFDRYPSEVLAPIESSVPRKAWDEYVSTTLRETKERDLSNLGGPIAPMGGDISSQSGSFLDDDDDYPSGSSGGNRSSNAAEGTSTAEGQGSKDNQGKGSQISTDVRDKFADSSDDTDEDEEGAEVGSWLRDPSFDPRDIDIHLEEGADDSPKAFGFDDRFGSAPNKLFSMAGNEDDDGWGPFGDSSASTSGFDDAFSARKPISIEKKNMTPADFNAQFKANFDDDPFGDSFGPPAPSTDEDDWGDFEAAPAAASTSFEDSSPKSGSSSRASPSHEAFGDYDFGESASPVLDQPSSFPSSPSSGPGATRQNRTAMDIPRSFDAPNSFPASNVSDGDHPLGPAINPTSRLADDGKVEAESAEGKVKVPKDSISLQATEGSRSSP